MTEYKKCPNCPSFKSIGRQCPACGYDDGPEHTDLCMCVLCIPTEKASAPDSCKAESDPLSPDLGGESG